ncbi:MAG: 1,4-alpha-glucan branching protein GlgB [Magnetococcus sp. WYHC-3]
MSMPDAALRRIAEARHHDPFDVLGRHVLPGGNLLVRVYLPHAEEAAIVEGNLPLQRIEGTDFFQFQGRESAVPLRYRVRWRDDQHVEHIGYDPYCFTPCLTDFDLHLFSEGRHRHAQNFLGSHAIEKDGARGVLFAVWAPNAERVSVVGDFNRWDGRRHPMRVRSGGVWELFIPNLGPGTLYKYELRSRELADTIVVKADPYGQRFEMRPRTASLVEAPSSHMWGDAAWMTRRAQFDWQHQPLSIYEIHPGSWRRGWEGEFLDYREMARQLAQYVKEMGFTHVELMPINEHPFDLSWGYQATGYFAPTSRFGSPDDFRFFVDHMHQNGIGVILDWVPAHFPKDAHGLARFDGTALYEHADPRKGEHLDWGTHIFNYGRNEVRTFLISSALHWLQTFHLDGLRVDAVASMLYLDYSRKEWVPNRHGGRENLEAMDFLRELNAVVHTECPGILMMAEESTSWPQVTRPPEVGGLGFSLKWNMGWMNDTLRYIANDPVHRKYHHNLLTFSLYYAFSENFLLPLSHDEVVHGKGALLGKMPGDEWQRHANVRALYLYQFTHPGKKLLFMGCEFAQGEEWNSTQSLPWHLLEYGYHRGAQALVRDLNHLYCQRPELHDMEFHWEGFEWINCHDSDQSVISFVRKNRAGNHLVVVINLTPVPRLGYRIGMPSAHPYQEILNSDSGYYGGGNIGNGGGLLCPEPREWMGRPYSVELSVPPLGGVILEPRPRPLQITQEDPASAVETAAPTSPGEATTAEV